MKDTVIKGTGNSRFLKSVENFKSLYPTYDAFVEALAAGTLPIDFNGVNPDGITQLGTPLSMSSLLKHATAAVFGFGEEAVPDDVLRTLSRFQAGLGNEHIWKKSKELSAEVPAGYTLGEVQENVTIFQVPSSSDSVTLVESSTVTVYDNGEVVLTDDGGFSTVASQFNGNGLQGWFVRFIEGSPLDSETIWYIPTDATFRNVNSSPWYSVVSKIQKVTGYPKIEAGTYVEYANSPHSYTYPPDEDDGFTYEYLGRLGEKARIEAGSYTGTGTYGSSNQNSLTFSFVPMAVFVSNHTSAPSAGAGFGFVYINGLHGSGNNVPTFTLSEKTLKWAGSSASYQLNASGTKYYYVAIG